MATIKTVIVKDKALNEAQVKQLLSDFGVPGSVVYSVEVPDDGSAVTSESTEPIALKPIQIGLLVVPTKPGNDG